MLISLRLLCLVGLHHRSREHRFRDQDKMMKSQCRRCGVRMVRERGSGRWLAHGSRDFRAQTAPIRDLLDQVTGPVIFLMALAILLGVTLWLHGDLAFDGNMSNATASSRRAPKPH